MKSVILLLIGLVFVYSNTCGGNCPSNGCTSCLCGSTTNYVSATTWCAKYSGWSQSCCQCIISHESNGNANAQNRNANGSNDVGLWQINDLNWAQCSGGSAPCDPSVNLECAKKVFAWGGNTWRLWSTCKVCGCCGTNVDEFENQEDFVQIQTKEFLPQ